MRSRGFAASAAVLAVSLMLAGGAQASDGTSLTLDPDPGEFLTGGASASFGLDDSRIDARYDGVSVWLDIARNNTDGSTELWSIQVAGPATTGLQVGTYDNITRAPFRPFGEAGLDIYSSRGGCNTISGRFTVNAFTPGPTGYKNGGYYYLVLDFDADFAIRCSEGPMLRGHISYEEPPDTTPPVIDQVNELSVEALPGDAGATVYYYLSARDERGNVYVPVTCSPPTGGTFLPIGETTVTCSATDEAGNTATTSFKVRVLTPFELGITADAFGSVDKTGNVTVSGRVSCNRSSLVEVFVHVDQSITRRATLSGENRVWVECSAPSTKWSAGVSATSGTFKPGKADTRVTAYSCPYYCRSAEQTRIVTLR